MKRKVKGLDSGEAVFVGIDLHKVNWHVTVRAADLELFSGSIPGRWEVLLMLLKRFRGFSIQVVYEAGCFGFRLYELLIEHGLDCIITSPSLIPQESGNRCQNTSQRQPQVGPPSCEGLT